MISHAESPDRLLVTEATGVEDNNPAIQEDTLRREMNAAENAQTQEQSIRAEEARERETEADEDPLEQQEAELADLKKPAPRATSWDLYGSARVRYRVTEDDAFWADGGSRIGLNGRIPVGTDKWIFGRAEVGINLLEELDFLFDRGTSAYGGRFGDTVFPRLLYAGIESPDFMLTAGKNWSTYYRVTSFTDRFQGTGASASGTFNAGTDGGFTGTGRADRVLQTRIKLGARRDNAYLRPGKLNIQVQHGEAIPAVEGFNYGTTIGVSALFETDFNFSAGIAYNHATIDPDDLEQLRSRGIDGDATALALGLRWYGEDWYVGSVLSRLNNHETTGQFNYFDGTGLEIYSQYQMVNRWWAIAGLNYLKPDDDQPLAGDFEIRYGVLGIRYSFNDFRQMIFANVRLDYGTSVDGDPNGNVYTVGVRWDLP